MFAQYVWPIQSQEIFYWRSIACAGEGGGRRLNKAEEYFLHYPKKTSRWLKYEIHYSLQLGLISRYNLPRYKLYINSSWNCECYVHINVVTVTAVAAHFSRSWVTLATCAIYITTECLVFSQEKFIFTCLHHSQTLNTNRIGIAMSLISFQNSIQVGSYDILKMT